MRNEAETRLRSLCEAVRELIEQEVNARNLVIEKVNARLAAFLTSNHELQARKRPSHAEAITTVRAVRYA